MLPEHSSVIADSDVVDMCDRTLEAMDWFEHDRATLRRTRRRGPRLGALAATVPSSSASRLGRGLRRHHRPRLAVAAARGRDAAALPGPRARDRPLQPSADRRCAARGAGCWTGSRTCADDGVPRRSRGGSPRRGLRLAVDFGRRVVNWTPEFMGFGNQLYLWAWAHAHRDEKPSPRVLVIDKMRYWIPHFPAVQPWLVERDRGRRARPARALLGRTRGALGRPARLHRRESRGLHPRLAPHLAGAGRGRRLRRSPPSDVLTLNVRRGDYYSNPVHRPEFAHRPGRLPEAGGRPQQWRRTGPCGACTSSPTTSTGAGTTCRGSRTSRARSPIPGPETGRSTTSGTSARPGAWSSPTRPSPSGARRSRRSALGETSVWAPAFFQRRYGPGRCYEYDQQWSFVDELPDGWQPGWVLAGRDSPTARET